jgi:hypothetical protein
MKTCGWLLLVLGAAGFIATAGAAEVSVAVNIRLGKAPPPPPPEIIIVEEAPRRGPPPWAPAHGRRAQRAYYYYPGCDVYYRPADRTWFYLEGRNWRAGISLPTHVHIDFDHCVSLEMDDDRPYVRHRDVVVLYPPDYFVRVKIKNRHPHHAAAAHNRDDRDHDGDHPGHGKSKGNGKGKNKGGRN